jgi:hypothetical protein
MKAQTRAEKCDADHICQPMPKKSASNQHNRFARPLRITSKVLERPAGHSFVTAPVLIAKENRPVLVDRPAL